MSQKPSGLIEERKRCISLRLQNTPISWIARTLNRSREWVYRWTKRYESGADRWYQDRSHRPHVMARQVSVSFERLVVRMHRALKGTRN